VTSILGPKRFFDSNFIARLEKVSKYKHSRLFGVFISDEDAK
jgi:hypothetical protein